MFPISCFFGTKFRLDSLDLCPGSRKNISGKDVEIAQKKFYSYYSTLGKKEQSMAITRLFWGKMTSVSVSPYLVIEVKLGSFVCLFVLCLFFLRV